MRTLSRRPAVTSRRRPNGKTSMRFSKPCPNTIVAEGRERRQNMSPLPSFVLCIPLRLRAAGCLLRSIHAAKEETVATLFLFFARIPIAGRLLPAASFPLNSAAPAAPPVPAAGAAPTRFCPRMARTVCSAFPPQRRRSFSPGLFAKRPPPCAAAPLSCGRRAPGRRVPSVATFFKVFRQAFFQKRPLPCATAPLTIRIPVRCAFPTAERSGVPQLTNRPAPVYNKQNGYGYPLFRNAEDFRHETDLPGPRRTAGTARPVHSARRRRLLDLRDRTGRRPALPLPALTGPWRYEGLALREPGMKEFWAPCVLEIDGHYYM